MKKMGVFFTLVFIMLCILHILLAPSKKEFAENDLYEEILKRGRLKVGICLDSKPFGFLDKDGNITGYDADLAHYIGQYIIKSANRVDLIPITTSNRLIKASTGEVDIVISTLTITPQREEIVSFSRPYDSAGQAILVSSKSAINSISDLGGQTVGVIFGTTAEKNMKNLVPNAHLRGFVNYQDAYKALKNNEINAITSDDTLLSRYTKDDPAVKLLPKRYSNEPYGIAFKKGSSTIKLKENLDYAIEDLERKNVIARLHSKWLDD